MMSDDDLLPARRLPIPVRVDGAPMERGAYGRSDAGAPTPALALWNILVKRRWTLVVTAGVLVLAVLGATLLQTPVFRSEALLEFKKESEGVPTIRDALELGGLTSEYLETQYKLLRSESLARRVIDDLRLERHPEFRGGGFFARLRGGPPPALAAPEGGEGRSALSLAERSPETYERVLAGFQSRLHVDPVINSRLVEVSFESEDALLAARAVDSLLDNYLAQSLEAGTAATGWLSDELSRVARRLEESEARLHDFAREKGLLFVERDEGRPANMASRRLQRLQDELTAAQSLRFQKESLYRLVQSGDVSALPSVFESKLIQDLTLRLSELKREEAQLSTVFDRRYPKLVQLREQIDKLQSLLDEERARGAARIVNEYEAASRQEALVREAFEEELRLADENAAHAARYNLLKREVETERQLHDSLLQRLREAGVSAGLDAASVRVVDRPRPPVKPVRPVLMLNLALALVGGLGFGIAASCLREYFDSSLDDPSEVERVFRLPALGLIPSVDGVSGGLYGQAKALTQRNRKQGGPVGLLERQTGDKRWYRIDGAENGRELLHEAFRNLRTSVLMPGSGPAARSVLVTSSEADEGKTTIASNLGIAVAQMGRRVLLIDADLRRPSLHRAFRLAAEPGLSDYLAGASSWRVACRSTDVPGLDVVVAGSFDASRSAELLDARLLHSLVGEALTLYDFVLLDSPPLLAVADARILATVVDGVLLVVKGNATPRELVYRAAHGTVDVGGRILGIVLNNLKASARSYSYRMPLDHGPGT